jgi:putative ABC transport system ATP-binding protein
MMESTIFKFILKYSRREQIILLIATLGSFPFLYMSLNLPKTIINNAIAGKQFPRDFLGFELEQIRYLLLLCGVFLILVIVNGGIKYFISVYSGVVGERMLRRLRYQLFEHVLRFPLPQFRKQSQGEIIAMITAESEPIGGFVGDSVALPVFQGGTLLTILVFMFVQDPILGTAAITLFPLQAYLIPKIQRRVNALNKSRVILIRQVSDRINEVVGGIQEVHAHDTSRLELADFSERMSSIYGVRLSIYRLKFFAKFLNNFIDKLTPFFFYSIGGYLVIRGSLSFGALVAVLAAYKDIASPWKELLTFYQEKENVRVKYDALIEGFYPPGLMDPRLQTEEPPQHLKKLAGDIVASNVDLRDEAEGMTLSDGGASFRFPLNHHVAILERGQGGADRLAIMLAGVDRPLSGSISIGELRLKEAPQAITGRRISYVGQEPRLRSGSVRDNILYSLKHRPVRPASYDDEARRHRERILHEAAMTGNSSHDINADWVDYEAAGISGPEEMTERIFGVLTMTDLAADIYQFGLRGTCDPLRHPELAARILEARHAMRNRLQDPAISPLVELFDRDRYNSNMTIAENILFGTPRNDMFSIESISSNDYMRQVLQDTGLMVDFVKMGRTIADIMLQLFADVAPDSDLFEQYSFINADDLPVFQSVLKRTEGVSQEALSVEDRNLLLSLPFKLIPARHRLGLVDEVMQDRLLEARKAFARGLGDDATAVEFFDPERYSSAISIQDNILFGRLSYGRARSASEVGAVVGEVVEKLDLRREVMQAGLDFSVGIAGSRLTSAQRQKLAIARAVLKGPDLLVLVRATAALDPATQEKIMKNLLQEFEGRGLIWVLNQASQCTEFDHAIVLDGGKVVEQGRLADLNRSGTILHSMLAAG